MLKLLVNSFFWMIKSLTSMSEKPTGQVSAPLRIPE